MNCIFGLCVKNNSLGLPKVFNNINKIRHLFNKIVIIAYYDISVDNSLELLNQLSKKYDIVMYILNPDGKATVAGKRTVNIARARNGILDEVYKNPNFSDYELFAMMDSNKYSCQGDIQPDVIKKYFNNELYKQWDSLSFARKVYYDLWAYSDKIFQIGCWCYPRIPTVLGETTCYNYQDAMKKHFNKTFFAEENAGKLIEVDSAFCGFAFYKKSAFKNCLYNGEWTTTHMDKIWLKKNLEIFKLFRNGQTDDCEHRHFHMMAKKINNARIMIACDQAFTPRD